MALALLVGGWAGAQRVDHPTAQTTLLSPLRPSLAVPGSTPILPWPTVGQGAVAIPSLSYALQSGPEAPVPIASLTKMATAVVILRDHPIPAGGSGPSITLTADDVNQYDDDLEQDETNIPLLVGEQLTELQMLEALMNQSANDIAYSLAVWDAGTEPAFVSKMNTLARSIGASDTHFVDASGYQPQSVSTAADMLRIAAAGMTIPAFADVVAMPTVTLPLVGTVHNIVSEVGSNGVVGIKSGFTSQAWGCMVLAGYRTIGGRSVLVLASALGQRVTLHAASPVRPSPMTPSPTAPGATSGTTLPGATTVPQDPLDAQFPLLYAGPVVEQLLDATESAIVPVTVSSKGQVLTVESSTWGGIRHQAPVVTLGTAWLFGWPGQHVAVATKPLRGSAARRPDGRVGTALYELGSQIEAVPLELAARMVEPTWWWRLIHG